METVFRVSDELGSYGTYVSGAGPTILSIVDAQGPEDFRSRAIAHLEERNVSGWRLELLQTDPAGAAIYID